MININARNERHAKLKNENIKLDNHSLNPVNATLTKLKSVIHKICHSQKESPLLGQLFRKIFTCVAIFLIIAPLMSTYKLTHNVYAWQYEDEPDILGSAIHETGSAIADVMTEDGFLLKPAINSAAGDRSGFSEIFLYTVESGDTLSSIAQSFNLKKETIMAENDLWNPGKLKVGSQLKILPVDGVTHKVQKGDTLDKIVKKYKVDKAALIKQNQIEKETLVTNMILIIPGAKPMPPVSSGSAITAPSNIANYRGPTATGRLIWPTIGNMTQRYHGGHRAIDIANSSKGAVYAAAGGKVVKAATGWNGGYGNMVIIDHGDGMETLYAHNEKLYVTSGQYVEQGQTIAWMGRTGRVYGKTGIHLHFEVRIKGVKYNPMNFF